MKKILFCLGLSIVILITLTGCGGGNDSGNGNNTITLYSDKDLDGYIINRKLAAPDYSGTFGVNTVYTGDMKLGSGPYYHGPTRVYISFDIRSIPAGVTIQSAVLRLYKQNQGADAALIYDPDTGLGNLLIDHIAYTSEEITNSFELLFLKTALVTLEAPFATELTLIGQWKEMNVTVQVQNDIATSRQHSQFRLRHHVDEGSDFKERTEHWSSGDSATNKPQLVIRYTL